MSKESMAEMMKGVHDKTTEGPVGVAVKYLIDCVDVATKRGLFKTTALWQACAVVVDHVRVQRQALLVAGKLVAALETGEAAEIAAWLVEFKALAVKARLHQFVEPSQYPKLEEQFRSPGQA